MAEAEGIPDGPVDAAAFNACIEKALAATPLPDDLVVMDSLLPRWPSA